MKRKLIPCLVASLFAAAAASAADEDEFSWNGSSIGIGVRGTRQEGGTRNGAFGTSATTTAPFKGPEDKAKLNEYRDVSNGVIESIDLQGSSSRNYVRFFGENFDLKDEYLNLRGGSYGVYKYQLYEDKMPHNLSWGALTPLSGTGGTLLTVPGAVPGNPAYPPAQNPSTWNQFDYKLQRNTYGGNFEFTDNSPWHSRVDFSETTMQGVRPQGGRLGTGSGNGMIEFGAPVDYKTRNYSLESGYSTKKASFSINVLNSKFNNSNDLMQWTNFYMLNNLDTSLLPPDNDLTRLSLNGTLRQLPQNSTLAARITWSKLTNSFGVTSGSLMPTSSASPPTGVGTLVTAPSSNTFNGEHETTSASLSLTSALGGGVDTKIYYNYYHTKNKSTLIEYALGGLGTDAANCPSPSFPTTSTANRFCIGPFPNSLFFYKKQDYGVDAGWRIDRGNKVSAGVNLLEVDREREDAEKTREDKIWLEYKNSMLEDLSGRIKYQFLERRSDLNAARPVGQSPFADATPAQVPFYFRAYDVSNANQNQVKVVLDWVPMPLLDTGFEVAWKKTDYKDLSYGRSDDLRREYNATVSYGNPKEFRITALLNYELVSFDQAYHQGAGPFPGGTQTATDFDWGTRNTQKNRLLGLIADWPVMERLALKGSYTWSKTGGGVDFTSGNTAGAGGFNGGPLVNYVTDNTQKQTFNLKGDYKVDRHWTATVGYVHEKYDYADDQMRSYQGSYPYYQNLGGTNNSWFSGAFANPSYRLDVYYATATYKF